MHILSEDLSQCVLPLCQLSLWGVYSCWDSAESNEIFQADVSRGCCDVTGMCKPVHFTLEAQRLHLTLLIHPFYFFAVC